MKDKIKKYFPWAVALGCLAYGVHEHCNNKKLEGELDGTEKVLNRLLRECSKQSYQRGKESYNNNNR